MVEQQAARVPVYAVVGISALIGVISLVRGWEPLRLLFSLYDDVDFPTWYLTSVAFTLIVGVLMLVAAYLIFTYKKRGLQIGLVAHVLYAGNTLNNARGGATDALGWLLIVLAVVALFLCYRNLTHDPERLLFS